MRRFRALVVAAVVAAAACFALAGWWPGSEPGPEPAVATPTPAPPPKPKILLVSDTLRRGETLSELFARQGVRGIDLSELADVLDPRRLRAGLVFNFRRPATDSQPTQIAVRATPDTRVLFHRVAEAWSAESETIRWEPEIVRIEGAIDHSLYEALDRQVADRLLPGPERMRLAWELAEVYAWQVDFTRDLRTGDRFQVLLERLISEEGEIRFGRVLAGDLELSGKSYTAFRFENEDGHREFYDDDGVSLRRAFLRAPLEFRRISSNFSRARYHPVLGRTRKHEGTDYAANAGTPVMASGNGVVRRAGWAGGYGRLIELRHRNGITTRYAHLSRIAVHRGERVQQGEVIGYVGSSGLATGPHLHYEFRINGVAVDSRRVDLGHGTPLKGADLEAFKVERDRLKALLYPQEPEPQLLAQQAN